MQCSDRMKGPNQIDTSDGLKERRQEQDVHKLSGSMASLAAGHEGEPADGGDAFGSMEQMYAPTREIHASTGGRSRGGSSRRKREGDSSARRSGKRPRLQLKAFSRDDFFDTERSEELDGFGLQSFPSARDPDFLYSLSCACEDNKGTWANLSYTGPALRHFNNFASLLPCSNSVCTKVSFRGAQGGSPAGGSKMFCLLRFFIDPEHVQPPQHTASMMRALSSGPLIKKLASTLHKTLSDKQALHGWDMSRLHDLGVLQRVYELGEHGDATRLMQSEAVAECLQHTPPFSAGDSIGGPEAAVTSGGPASTVAAGGGAHGNGAAAAADLSMLTPSTGTGDQPPDADIADPKTLEELTTACEDAQTSWANIAYIGPRLNQQFQSIVESFPCQDSRCSAAKSRGIGKIFCLLRFMLDPQHFKPDMLAALVHRNIQQNGTLLSFISFFIRVFEEKRAAHRWGRTALDELGIISTLAGMARGDVPMPSLGPGASMIGATHSDRYGRRRREHATSQDGMPVAQPVSIASAPYAAPASEHPPAPLPPRPRVLHGDQFGGHVEGANCNASSSAAIDDRLRAIESAVCALGESVGKLGEQFKESTGLSDQDYGCSNGLDDMLQNMKASVDALRNQRETGRRRDATNGERKWQEEQMAKSEAM